MANPILGIFINGIFYNYVSGSYTRQYLLKNKTNKTQKRKTTTLNGNDFPIHAIGLHLPNVYSTLDTNGNVSVGQTTNLGISQLAYLLSVVGDNNTNNFPLTFIAPDGSTHAVIPTNSMDVSLFNPDAPNITGVEFRVNLTLENINSNTF